MVFFVCEGCNETLKKNQVEKHSHQCRYCEAVTCVDCSVTFYGNDYAQHISCVSEAEKYEKSLFKPKKEKSANPQDAWVALIEAATSDVSNAPPSIRSHLVRIGQLSNVPRNKKKFVNFAKNSLRLYNEAQLEALWNYLDGFRTATSPASQLTGTVSEKPEAPAPASTSSNPGSSSDGYDGAHNTAMKHVPSQQQDNSRTDENTKLEKKAKHDRMEKKAKKDKKDKKEKKEKKDKKRKITALDGGNESQSDQPHAAEERSSTAVSKKAKKDRKQKNSS